MRRSVCFLDIGARGLKVLIIATIWLCMASNSFLVAGERIIVDGKVSANKDKNSNVIAVSVITNSGEVLKIILDKNGKKLAEETDGKWVEVIADEVLIVFGIEQEINKSFIFNKNCKQRFSFINIAKVFKTLQIDRI